MDNKLTPENWNFPTRIEPVETKVSKQAIVDYAIRLYEEGALRDAYSLLDAEGFSKEFADRVLKNPDQRKAYINDFITGF